MPNPRLALRSRSRQYGQRTRSFVTRTRTTTATCRSCAGVATPRGHSSETSKVENDYSSPEKESTQTRHQGVRLLLPAARTQSGTRGASIAERFPAPCRIIAGETLRCNASPFKLSAATTQSAASPTNITYACVPSFFNRSRSSLALSSAVERVLRLATRNAQESIGFNGPIPEEALLIVAVSFQPREHAHPEEESTLSALQAVAALGAPRESDLEIVGVCVAVEREIAWRVHIETKSEHTSDAPPAKKHRSEMKVESVSEAHVATVGDTWCYGTSLCGIHLVWVPAHQRHAGVATNMVHAARQHVTFGYEVPPEHVAFYEPTRDGSRFAAAFSERKDFLVY